MLACLSSSSINGSTRAERWRPSLQTVIACYRRMDEALRAATFRETLPGYFVRTRKHGRPSRPVLPMHQTKTHRNVKGIAKNGMALREGLHCRYDSQLLW